MGGLATLLAGLVLRVGRGPGLGVPFTYSGDSIYFLMFTRSLGEGHYLTNPNLGFPFGQELYDFPQGGDNLNWLLLRLFAVTGRPGLAVNLFFLLCFFLVASAAYFVLRYLGLRPLAAGVPAVLYALLPFHFERNTAHLPLANYSVIPFAVLLGLWVLAGDAPRFGWKRWRPELDAKAWGAVAVCIVAGSTGTYYATFTALLLIVAAAAVFLAKRSWSMLVSASVQVGVVVAVFLLNQAPSLLYWLRHGANNIVVSRSPAETELYGLRISRMLLPRNGHRVGALSRIAERAEHGSPVVGEPGQALGVIGIVGIVVLLGVVVVRLAGRSNDSTWWRTGPSRLLTDAGLLAVACMLIGAAGGFSYLLSVGGLEFVRSWNRIVVVIAFLVFLTIGVLANEWTAKWGDSQARWRRGLPALCLVGALVIGVVDETSPNDGRLRDVAASTWRSDQGFFEGMRESLPEGSAVFVLPAIQFPDVPVPPPMGIYDHAAGYVHAPSLKWSYGAMKGRVPPFDAVKLASPEVVSYLRELGFAAVVVDRFGYPDRGVEVEARLTSALAARLVSSPDGRYGWIRLR